ncbi:hypothetical protein M422DRAFT_259369 [Sphaerobolus stellatus SS14]|uniref:DUF6534 domain-containing protein n=1 Tax=Sphaerobolus stellatus (strain SS14) TaxID=990650 RepID=A0A0C9UIF7_SPHS4|nr:hypothetical protein M422DRAFT_274123 [Sphaerobolus stellatus SS14]KIJ37983.1 hypothetical protein M422DRAFT_259369 [Sphaerobolus stellatus SS14]
MSNWKWILLVPYGCAALCDTIITGSLCWYLYKTPKEFARTQLLVNKLIVYTVNTSFWTTLFVVLDLIAFIVWPKNWVYVGVFLLISKLYTNSVLGILNSRQRLRDEIYNSNSVNGIAIPETVVLSTMRIRSPGSPGVDSDGTGITDPRRHTQVSDGAAVDSPVDDKSDFLKLEHVSSS